MYKEFPVSKQIECLICCRQPGNFQWLFNIIRPCCTIMMRIEKSKDLTAPNKTQQGLRLLFYSMPATLVQGWETAGSKPGSI